MAPNPLANLPRNPPIYKASGFDPEPLERAAELSKGPKAQLWKDLKTERSKRDSTKEDISKLRQETRGLQSQEKRAAQQARQQLEELRKQAHGAVEEHKHQLKGSAEKDLTLMKEQLNARLEDGKAEFIRQQEAVHAETLKQESRLKYDVDIEVIKRRTEGDILAERTNQDQRLEMLKANAGERRETLMASIKVA